MSNNNLSQVMYNKNNVEIKKIKDENQSIIKNKAKINIADKISNIFDAENNLDADEENKPPAAKKASLPKYDSI